jgi:hypothetical protein
VEPNNQRALMNISNLLKMEHADEWTSEKLRERESKLSSKK